MLQCGSAESDGGFSASVDLPAGIDLHFRPHPVVFRFIRKAGKWMRVGRWRRDICCLMAIW
nr:MAG TPA: hypothetical protein [Caudoviricetes sp.]